MAAATDGLMTVTQWGQRLGIGKTAAYARVARGEVDRVNVGTVRRPMTRITEAAHREYLERRKQQAPGRGAGAR